MRLRPFLLAGSAVLVAAAGLASVNNAAAFGSGSDDDVLFAQATPPAAPPPAAGGGSAQPGDRPMDRMHHMHSYSPKAMCQEHVARRIGNRAYLKSRLELKPEQMPAWNAFEKAANEASTKDLTRCASLPAEAGTPPTYPERLALQEDMMKARLESIQAVKPSLEALYAALTPEQKAVLDRPTRRRHASMMHGPR
jgi:hypothetical protein